MPSLAKLRHQAFLHQSGCCHYCGLPTWEKTPEPVAKRLGVKPHQARGLKCTAEHLKPRCNGGKDTPENIVAACLHCNSTRHKFKKPPSPDHYRLHVQKRIANGGWHPGALVHKFNSSRTECIQVHSQTVQNSPAHFNAPTATARR